METIIMSKEELDKHIACQIIKDQGQCGHGFLCVKCPKKVDYADLIETAHEYAVMMERLVKMASPWKHANSELAKAIEKCEKILRGEG